MFLLLFLCDDVPASAVDSTDTSGSTDVSFSVKDSASTDASRIADISTTAINSASTEVSDCTDETSTNASRSTDVIAQGI